MTPHEIAVTIARALDAKKGIDIKVLEIEKVTTLADYFVICTSGSTTQIRALVDECERVMKEHDLPPHHIEGHGGGTWVLLDYSSVVVHVFIDEARKFYTLEHLWSDAVEVNFEP